MTKKNTKNNSAAAVSTKKGAATDSNSRTAKCSVCGKLVRIEAAMHKDGKYWHQACDAGSIKKSSKLAKKPAHEVITDKANAKALKALEAERAAAKTQKTSETKHYTVRSYRDGTVIGTIFSRLESSNGKALSFVKLFKGIDNRDAIGRLRWIRKHGQQSKAWSVTIDHEKQAATLKLAAKK